MKTSKDKSKQNKGLKKKQQQNIKDNCKRCNVHNRDTRGRKREKEQKLVVHLHHGLLCSHRQEGSLTL